MWVAGEGEGLGLFLKPLCREAVFEKWEREECSLWALGIVHDECGDGRDRGPEVGKWEVGEGEVDEG